MSNLAQQIAELSEDARKALYADLARAQAQRDEAEQSDQPSAMVLAGAPIIMGKVTIPPLSFGALACLEESGNPLLREDADIDSATMLDVYEVLFVAAHQDVALPILYRLSRCRASIDATKELAEKSAEHYERYLAARQRLIEEVAVRWDVELKDFARSLSGIPPADVREAAKAALEDALRPFVETP